MSKLHVKVELDEVSYRSLVRAFKSEADGKELRRDLAKSWRAAASVAANDARRSIRATPSQGSGHEMKLREAIARGVQVHTFMGAARMAKSKMQYPGVSIAWHRSSMAKAPRGKFKRPASILWRAGQLLNRGARWEHPVFGRGKVITSVPAAKGWFDDAIDPHKPGMVLAVKQAYREMVDRIERRAVSRRT